LSQCTGDTDGGSRALSLCLIKEDVTGPQVACTEQPEAILSPH